MHLETSWGAGGGVAGAPGHCLRVLKVWGGHCKGEKTHLASGGGSGQRHNDRPFAGDSTGCPPTAGLDSARKASPCTFLSPSAGGDLLS